MTGSELKALRQSWGLSTAELARLLGVGSGRTIRRYEAGDRAVAGPLLVLLELFQAHPELLKESRPESSD